MVSIFGIKLGSDRKKDKAQNKQHKDKSSQPKKGLDSDKKAGRESQYFGNNFSRPNACASPRPGTSYSTRRTTLFHQPFTFPAASSSMVDLAPPGRRPSVGSLRQTTSDTDTRGWRDRNESPVPPPVLSPPSRRPGTGDRPLSSRRSAWINPLDVHYVRDPAAASQPDTPRTNGSATTTPFSDFEFGLAPKNSAPKTEPPSTEGYPSPPASISSVDHLHSVPSVNPDNRPSSSRRNAPPSGLRRVNTLDEVEGPPTPERTLSQTSQEQPSTSDGGGRAVVRNARAQRETLAFHQPRQPSMIMDLDGAHEKRWERDASDDTGRSPPVEGFEGNFAAFDFGETVRRASVSVSIAPDDKRSTAHTMRTTSNFSGHPSLDTMGSALGAQWPSPPTDADDAAGFGGNIDRTSSGARSFASPKREETTRPSAPPSSLDSPIIPPDHFRTRDLLPPRPHTSGGPRPNTGPPPAAAGAYRGLAGLDPPSRGFLNRPRVDSASGPSTRAPPKPLQLRPLADRSEHSPRGSPYGPALDEGSHVRSEGESHQPVEASPYGPTLEGEGNYMRTEGSARRPPDVPGSPFSRATPIEGDFPVTKGLPRGRRPVLPSQPTPTSEDTTAPSPTDEANTALGLPSWIDRAAARQSAMPAPLSPLRGAPTTTTTTISTSTSRPPNSPHRPLRSDEFTFPDTPTSPSGAPRLPSPTFHSLEKSISSSSENLARTFADFAFDSKPLISPVLGDFGASSRDPGEANPGRMSPRRVEGRTAPPRPSPVTLPPSSGQQGVRTPGSPPAEFTSTFI
ncbi:hypothetical protein NLU13_2409 [Sarocladium strictum]|uniref:Uncharacterized protein n=1 Tax=Sarocladium strictum TaxID=5046 RepID=A0AA39LD90_SARSR|nr:hypothetical protein NLU13_2409 [Sarocladium strictum]